MDICFYDQDFLSPTLEHYIGIYLRSPEFLETRFNVDLDQYIDLMPADLRELYLEKKQIREQLLDDEEIDIEHEVIIELCSAISILQNHLPELINKGEVEISNEIYRMLKRLFKKSLELEIEREAPIGRAKVKLGETDFAIYINNDKYYQNVAIVESKLIERFLNEYGQLLGYLNPSFIFGVTISINKEKKLDEATGFIIDKLKSIKDDDFKLISIIENPFGDEYKYIIKSEHSIPEDASRTMSIYHLIINFHDQARERIAKESREKSN